MWVWGVRDNACFAADHGFGFAVILDDNMGFWDGWVFPMKRFFWYGEIELGQEMGVENGSKGARAVPGRLPSRGVHFPNARDPFTKMGGSIYC